MKYKTLKFGQSYINKDGSFVICLLDGSRKYGYIFAASHVHPSAILGIITIGSRVVDNDGYWTEIPTEVFNVASALHVTGHTMKIPAQWRGSDIRRDSDGSWDRLSYMRMWAKTPPTISKYS